MKARGDCGFQTIGMEAEVGVGIDGHGHRATEFGQVLVHDEVGIEKDRLVAGGVEGGEHGEHEAGGGAGEDQEAGIGPAGVAGDFGFKGGDELGDSLGGGVAVFTFADGLDGAFLEDFGDIKIGLADGEVDGVFELGGEVKDFPDAGGVDLKGALGDERL